MVFTYIEWFKNKTQQVSLIYNKTTTARVFIIYFIWLKVNSYCLVHVYYIEKLNEQEDKLQDNQNDFKFCNKM